MPIIEVRRVVWGGSGLVAGKALTCVDATVVRAPWVVGVGLPDVEGRGAV